ncbi:MAG: tRNA (adenosine(37)-N6)-threonylcarbamoyltransferase complex ATPase subunit type 1 TsaE [Verrucomicrobia bacterium]|nr:tRNA (adenosine(37)-N6)-threonylcarbamoyltransferase complex ATPase subunit type 1 TsaE [Verrucomicrobiota bacterium]MBV9673282.1 tRNA (adenosine(37)-N6)-threonylcarbamoyltransferase complex ATPase subunit type 1 TsaE [Verrucomicrobiota bacterium]
MTVRSGSPGQTRRIGYDFAHRVASGAVLSLVGDLGAGKTEFVKGLAEGLGSAANVTSPTFTLVHQYLDGRIPLYHFDLYRLQAEWELDEIGFQEYLRPDVICAIEWGNKTSLPETKISIRFEFGSAETRIVSW